MNILKKVAVLLLVLATAACTNPDRFGGGAGGAGGAGADGGLAGSASDPASPQFFNQTIGDRVLFAVDQSTITDQGKSILDGQAQWLMTNTDYRAVIEGHADEQGTREYNLALGFRRANAVREYLVSRGVPSSRLEVTSYGKERPIEVCSNESCYAQNRRAVTVLSFSAITS
ncbi:MULTISPECIES: peptidoglycan-associated lipoprotein Pal [unclassified Cognatiyoonia]|uniref:peptidoglycan-associated lipoprotein Pal n=1 Tax=unclassified Cognatiyoonia TaxID=2635977 RepID=UPI002A13358E|nr:MULTISPECIES: peptidoglycan-associated lipoprotein Pal [unclassified Cognatiyoonia]MDX8347256.1 peptidoglycan-associated lipoprotein Pal [Cognatiyoonia sp. IB215446]MDX8351501.1 peptidoglycan-associated lipoprotein Pal [Cognatiyoonia sp. IB215182]